LEDLPRPPSPKNKRVGGGRNNWNKRKGLGWSASGAELGKWMGLPGDDSVSRRTFHRIKFSKCALGL